MRRLIAVLAALAVAVLAGATTGSEEVEATRGEPVTLRVAGQLGVDSPEGLALQAELDAYSARRPRVTIVYEDYVVLDDAINGPDPVDLVIVPQPANLRENAGELVDVSRFVWERRLRRDYGDYPIDQVTVDGDVVGIPIRAQLKSLVWYQPDRFAQEGYQVPETFTELIALSDTIVTDGNTPWCNYLESGAATGWLGTDWVEDLLLTAEGPEVYDQWVDHDVLFVDPRVESAFDDFLQLMDTPGYVFDRGNITNVFFFDNVLPLGDGDCFMHKQASFFVRAIQGYGFDLADFDTFEFPPVDTAFADAAMGGNDYVAAVTDNWRVRQLVRFMASPRFGKHAIADGSPDWILPNVRFDTSRYAEEPTRSDAETIRAALEAGQFRFDASDMMPPEVGTAFWVGMRDLLDGTRPLAQVLSDTDAAWPT